MNPLVLLGFKQIYLEIINFNNPQFNQLDLPQLNINFQSDDNKIQGLDDLNDQNIVRVKRYYKTSLRQYFQGILKQILFNKTSKEEGVILYTQTHMILVEILDNNVIEIHVKKNRNINQNEREFKEQHKISGDLGIVKQIDIIQNLKVRNYSQFINFMSYFLPIYKQNKVQSTINRINKNFALSMFYFAQEKQQDSYTVVYSVLGKYVDKVYYILGDHVNSMTSTAFDKLRKSSQNYRLYLEEFKTKIQSFQQYQNNNENDNNNNQENPPQPQQINDQNNDNENDNNNNQDPPGPPPQQINTQNNDNQNNNNNNQDDLYPSQQNNVYQNSNQNENDHQNGINNDRSKDIEMVRQNQKQQEDFNQQLKNGSNQNYLNDEQYQKYQNQNQFYLQEITPQPLNYQQSYNQRIQQQEQQQQQQQQQEINNLRQNDIENQMQDDYDELTQQSYIKVQKSQN